MNEKYYSALKQLQKESSLLNWFKFFSIETWNRINFARSKAGLKIYETTITQNLLLNIRMFAETKTLPIEMFEATSEKTNGNDIEIVLEIEEGKYIILPCQAKIVWKNQKYPTIKHKVNKTENQIDLLISYAEKVQGIPIYLFYNWFNDSSYLKDIEHEIRKKDQLFDYELYGCSIACAHKIKKCFAKPFPLKKIKWEIPSFKDLHPEIAIPLYFIALNYNLDNFKKLFPTINPEAIKIYSEDEIMNNNLWRNLFPSSGIGYVRSQGLKFEPVSFFNKFTPSSRIVFQKNLPKKGNTISLIS
ncbi:DUF6615 family protein [Aureispira anguillae]|uniref:Uncharacterized protein n=1 Tax=Aureispira anguillae TaxID=2864201 RepID=A0A915YDB8_9BACT|nr:DUF6615 family protein [Aureispira anguillae]BDS10978.1 hypothetical protein AsAng_0016880 [Aureispira anguillae]